MGGSTFGKTFRIHTYGESHGAGIGVVIDGCPAGISWDDDLLVSELNKRRPGQSDISTQRKESDRPVVQSGVFEGKTTGTPIAIYIPNKDHKSSDYAHIANAFRPSHGDMTWQRKFGIRDYRGGGRSSARETAARVAAGAVARMFLSTIDVRIMGGVTRVGQISLDIPLHEIDWSGTEQNIVRCPDARTAERMEAHILEVQKSGDTIGGIVSCVIENCPAGLGEPVFDKLHADLAKAMLSINAVKGFEYGSGFRAAGMRGSEHNDQWVLDKGREKTQTNYSGGIQGGISNGMPIYFNVAFKPVATIMRDQESINDKGEATTIEGKGRHDPCVVPRAVPIVEAMSALVIADHLLRNRTSRL